MINVNSYRCYLIAKYDKRLSSLFMEELSKWDQTQSINDLYEAFYQRDVLNMLFLQALERY